MSLSRNVTSKGVLNGRHHLLCRLAGRLDELKQGVKVGIGDNGDFFQPQVFVAIASIKAIRVAFLPFVNLCLLFLCQGKGCRPGVGNVARLVQDKIIPGRNPGRIIGMSVIVLL